MTKEGLEYISSILEKAGVNYCFGQWSKSVRYPYFVGEYIEKEAYDESGERENLFILTGTTDKSYMSLETEKEKICQLFPDNGITHVFENGNGIAAGYKDAFYIPTNTDKLKRIQINIKILEWRVI